ncbi:hypothetical protein [Mastigocladopsis repens]|uniref:hypothetical protein n=1 Tax=Mastigocladopsis repens TaxID=221287 RepID=UPI0003777C5E|nr:hypothetical protein [Mastigocladopsis repens]
MLALIGLDAFQTINVVWAAYANLVPEQEVKYCKEYESDNNTQENFWLFEAIDHKSCLKLCVGSIFFQSVQPDLNSFKNT